MGCQCQCRKPKQENPLDEILSEKDLDKNQLTNRIEPNEKINGNVFKNNKPQEIPIKPNQLNPTTIPNPK